MENIKQKSIHLLKEFKGDNYIFGIGVANKLGRQAALIGKNVLVVADGFGQEWAAPALSDIKQNLCLSDLVISGGDFIPGAAPNAPRNDVMRISEKIRQLKPDVIMSVGGGSTIDATKAAIAYSILGSKHPDMDTYFGTGLITEMVKSENCKLIPHLAVMMAASSAAHLTKYSNITDPETNQKMLIVDPSVVPEKALFDYTFTKTQPYSLTVDGAMDGISHALEVLMGIPEAQLEKVMPVCLTGMELIVSNLKRVVSDPSDMDAREGIGLGTDLGGYAIMIGGTNGAHLNSFSMTDILSHGRACAIMNPYYVVFFAPVIESRLREVGKIFRSAGYIRNEIENISGRDLGMVIASGIISFSKEVGFPSTLGEVPGFTPGHIRKCLEAAKNPKLESKLKNMPVPLSAGDVDEYMGSVLFAAENGNMDLIKNL
jgi:alcohol dehydrogenase